MLGPHLVDVCFVGAAVLNHLSDGLPLPTLRDFHLNSNVGNGKR